MGINDTLYEFVHPKDDFLIDAGNGQTRAWVKEITTLPYDNGLDVLVVGGTVNGKPTAFVPGLVSVDNYKKETVVRRDEHDVSYVSDIPRGQEDNVKKLLDVYGYRKDCYLNFRKN